MTLENQKSIASAYAISVAPFDLSPESEIVLQENFGSAVRLTQKIVRGVNVLRINSSDLEVLYEAGERQSQDFPRELGQMLMTAANIIGASKPIVPVVLVSEADRTPFAAQGAMKLLAPAA